MERKDSGVITMTARRPEISLPDEVAQILYRRKHKKGIPDPYLQFRPDTPNEISFQVSGGR